MAKRIQKSDLKLFSKKQMEVLELLEGNDNINEVFFGGAAGGGKSFVICNWQIARRLEYPETRGLIGRQSLKNLKLTTFKTFCDVWHKYYRHNKNGVEWRLNGSTNIIHFTNGSEIVLMDLGHYPSDPEYHRLGSLEISDCAIDELAEIKQASFEILQSRIRYKLDEVGGVPKILSTGNPSNNWVKERYIRNEKGELAILKPHQAYVRATVHDNPNEAFKRTYIKALERLNPIHRLRLLDGNWDVQLNDNPFFYSFNREKHYRPVDYEIDPRYPLLISYDFNRDPCTAVVAQHTVHNLKWHIIGSHFASPDHKSSLENLCDLIRRVYFTKVNRFNVTITGDSAGRQGDADRATNINRYTAILNYLDISKQQISTEKSNMKHTASRDLCNDCFHQIPKGHLVFYAGTERLIENICASYPDQRGSLEGAKRELGLHDVDAFRYLMKYYFAKDLVGVKINKYHDLLESYKIQITRNESRKVMA